MEKRIKITLIKSVIGQKKRVKGTITALGIKRLHHSVTHKVVPEITGMVKAVNHLVKVEEVK